MSHRGLRCAGVAAALTLVSALAATPAASAASSARYWGAAVQYPNASELTSVLSSVACTSRGNCVAAGTQVASSGNPEQGIVAVESANAWGAPVIVSPPSSPASASPSDIVLTAVSCQSASSCVAVGRYKNNANGTDPIIVPLTISGATVTLGAAVSPVPPATPDAAYDATTANSDAVFDGVSCTAGGCTAVGSYTDTSGDQLPMTATGSATGAWTTSEATLPGAGSTSYGGELDAVSCPPTGTCEAVGSYGDSAGNNNHPWALALTGAGAVGAAVTPPADYSADSLDETAPNVTVGGLDAISCPAAGVCTAGGSYTTAQATDALVVPISGGVPQAPTKLAAATETSVPMYDISSVSGIWCSDAGDCTVSGTAAPSVFPVAAVDAEIAGSWSTLSPLTVPSSAIYSLGSGLSCTDVEDCTSSVVELTADSSGSYQTAFAVSAPTLVVSTTALQNATVGQPYSITLQTSGGVSGDKPTWAATLGSLPAGLSLNAATGVISGTPTAAGETGVVFTATDPGPPSQSPTASLTITVAPAAAVAVPTVTLAYSAANGSKATLVLTCSGAPCAGAIGLTASEHLKGTTPTAVTAAAGKHKKKKKTGGNAKTKKITLATGRYSITAGGSQTVTLTLNGSAAKLLKKLHKLTGTLTLTPTGATKPAVINTVKFTAAPKTNKPKPKK